MQITAHSRPEKRKSGFCNCTWWYSCLIQWNNIIWILEDLLIIWNDLLKTRFRVLPSSLHLYLHLLSLIPILPHKQIVSTAGHWRLYQNTVKKLLRNLVRCSYSSHILQSWPSTAHVLHNSYATRALPIHQKNPIDFVTSPLPIRLGCKHMLCKMN